MGRMNEKKWRERHSHDDGCGFRMFLKKFQLDIFQDFLFPKFIIKEFDGDKA